MRRILTVAVLVLLCATAVYVSAVRRGLQEGHGHETQ
jgi:hypothetical protein